MKVETSIRLRSKSTYLRRIFPASSCQLSPSYDSYQARRLNGGTSVPPCCCRRYETLQRNWGSPPSHRKHHKNPDRRKREKNVLFLFTHMHVSTSTFTCAHLFCTLLIGERSTLKWNLWPLTNLCYLSWRRPYADLSDVVTKTFCCRKRYSLSSRCRWIHGNLSESRARKSSLEIFVGKWDGIH